MAVVVAWEWLGCSDGGRLTLETGAVLELILQAGACNGPTYTKSPILGGGLTLSSGPGDVDDGDLIMLGTGPDGAWYAAARSQPRDPACPFVFRGAAFDAGPNLHFESGLLLPKGSTFAIEPGWIEHPADLLPKGGVSFCLNRAGEVILAQLEHGG